MTAAAGDGALPESPVDAHAPKLLPDDPRLRLGRPAARTLRAGPLVALVAGLSGAVVLAVALALESSSPANQSRPNPSGAPPPPIVPEAIRNAPSRAAMLRAASLAREIPGFRRRKAARGFKTPRRGMSASNGSRPRTPRFSSILRAPARTIHAPPNGAPVPARPQRLHRSRGAWRQRRSESSGPQKCLSRGPGPKAPETPAATLQHPKSPYELQAGTLLPTVLLTAINSDLPGPVIGQVRENVYDTASGNFLLVPQGSRLIARYDSMVAHRRQGIHPRV